MTAKKTLILTPFLTISGGVANYYRVMKEKFRFDYDYHYVGDRQNASASTLTGFVKRAAQDYVGFIKRLIVDDYRLVMISPSLNLKGFLRDYMFFLIAKTLGYKVIIFFRGWDKKCEDIVFYRWSRIFFLPLRKSSAIIVLADNFRQAVKALAPNVPVYVETTVFDEALLNGISTDHMAQRLSQRKKLSALFLSRIEENKGVFQAIEAFSILKQRGVDIELSIAGSGSVVEQVKAQVEQVNNPDLRFLGLVQGEQKRDLLLSTDIMLFPSDHGEGMPNTIMEAMGSGMAVITTLMGGLKDFFIEGEMGQVLVKNTANELAEKIIRFEDRQYLEHVARNNHVYAAQYFYGDVVAKRIKKILDSVARETAVSSTWFPEH